MEKFWKLMKYGEVKKNSMIYLENQKNLFYVKKIKNRAVAIYCHYDRDNIIKDYVVQGLKTLMILGYDIYFCTTSDKIINIDLPFRIYYFKNKDNITVGNDIFMFYEILKIINFNLYDWFLQINDSMLFPIHGIEEMDNTIKKKEKNAIFGEFIYQMKRVDIKMKLNIFVVVL